MDPPASRKEARGVFSANESRCSGVLRPRFNVIYGECLKSA
jgi:hypothetical protein